MRAFIAASKGFSSPKEAKDPKELQLDIPTELSDDLLRIEDLLKFACAKLKSCSCELCRERVGFGIKLKDSLERLERREGVELRVERLERRESSSLCLECRDLRASNAVWRGSEANCDDKAAVAAVEALDLTKVFVPGSNHFRLGIAKQESEVR